MDIGTALDQRGVAVRTGHHCCMPAMACMNIAGTARASFAMYNTTADVDALVAGLREIVAKASKKAAAASTPQQQEVEYPQAIANSAAAAADDLAGDFELLGDREARGQYVLDLGERLPNYFGLLKKVTPRVPGCMSEVYLVARKRPETSDVLEFVADADAAIVRGLIAVLQRLFSGQRVKDVLAFDTESFFRRIGLDQFVSSQRRNGLAGMIARIRKEAEAVVKS
jgi:cysteine desulfurase/selenocysteine lyase